MTPTSRLQFALCSLILLATSVTAQQTKAENSQTKSPESSMITGRVVNDSGQPLAGVSVSVSPLGSSGGQRTATDNEGNFKAQGLDAGIYRIFASSPGYVNELTQSTPNSSPSYYRPGDSATLRLIKGGVIAGTVTNANGDPVVNVPLRAIRVRDAEGKKVESAGFSQTRLSDDRGYYRLYGLQAGSYVVSAGGPGQYFGVNPYGNDAPTYAPASTRDTAAEFVVHPDQEVTADIRYRGEQGHFISGKITGVASPIPYNAGVRLLDIESRYPIGAATATGEDRAFQLNGIADGEYEISALSGGVANADMAASAPRRVTVKGADITGLELNLLPMSSISGRVNIELDPKLNCGRRREAPLRQTLISVRRDRAEQKADQKDPKTKPVEVLDSSFLPVNLDLVPSDKGEINARTLYAGRYRIEAKAPAAGWYVKSIGAPPEQRTPRAPAPNIARDGIALKTGEKISGITITITEGGGGLRGRISVAEGQSRPPNLRVYLAPAERDAAENVLRFFETPVDNDGNFAIGNIAPGQYLIVARVDDPSDATEVKSVRLDSTLRTTVLREAQASKKELLFQPCERKLDYDLRYNSNAPAK